MDKTLLSPPPITVLMANLPAMIAGLLHRLLEGAPDFRVLNSALAIGNIPLALRGDDADILILGVFEADPFGELIQALERLRDQRSKVRVLVILEKPAYAQTVALFRAGASGIIAADDLQFEVLCRSLHSIRTGQIWVNSELLQHLVEASRPQNVTDSTGKPLLTKREQQVLEFLADGLSNSEIAAELHLSEHTVKNHLFRIYEKLGVSNRMEAALYFLTPRLTPVLPLKRPVVKWRESTDSSGARESISSTAAKIPLR